MRARITLALLLAAALLSSAPSQEKEKKLYLDPINVNPPDVKTDKGVKYDFDIVYVRAPRFGDDGRSKWTEIAHPALMDAGADLVLLHPDGTEEVLVEGGADGSVTDPFVSLDGESVFYSHIKGLKGTGQHGPMPREGADIYKIHVKSKKIVRLTFQQYEPNTGAGNWSKDFRTAEQGKSNIPHGVLNMGPCPLPNGKLVFTSSRNGFRPPKHPSPCQQLFVMNDDGTNVECIGHLNLGMALHPVVLKDGRIMFSSLESQGLRSSIMWGLWTIHPDGTNWGPMISAFLPGEGAPNAFHFQTQLSDGMIVAEEYYNQNNNGFGTYLKLPPTPPAGQPAFGPGNMNDARNAGIRFGRFDNGNGQFSRFPFMPTGVQSLTRFAHAHDSPANPSTRGKKDSTGVGKVTHPAAAPDNHLLTIWSPGPANHQYKHPPEVDGGIYLIKKGEAIDEPGQMLLIKNDPKYNEQWPRALVPYKRIYGIDEPATIKPIANDGKLSKHLPAGTPFALVGTSSNYKRESYPNGGVAEGSVTAAFIGKQDRDGYAGLDPFNTSENGASLNWVNQGADAGKYTNNDVHAIRILVEEPTTDRHGAFKGGRLFHSHARERLRIIGEIPLRKFRKPGEPGASATGGQLLDPDGNPDTSYLAKLPADVAFTFQLIDKNGMVLNMAQTWHQLRPGEVRNDCGGCHAHSQQPTLFEKTAAARPDYQLFDLTEKTPLLTSKARDESKQQWDDKDTSGLRYAQGIVNVEYHRDVAPILKRSCAACHTKEAPAGSLVLDDDELISASYVGKVPGAYYRLALDKEAKYSYKPVIPSGHYRQFNASRYIREFQSRRSLLIWKVFGQRLDGWSNDDFPTETKPGDATTLMLKGQPVENTRTNQNRADLDYNGKEMPPKEAVAGTYMKDGKAIKVEPLSDEDRLTLVRWIDLGCPIDLDYNPAKPEERGYGWLLDDNRPTLALTEPRAGATEPITRILVGMHDYYSGLEPGSFTVTADFAIDGHKPGDNLAGLFKSSAQGVLEYKLDKPIARLEAGKLTVSVKDKQGNLTRIERVLQAGKSSARR